MDGQPKLSSSPEDANKTDVLSQKVEQAPLLHPDENIKGLAEIYNELDAHLVGIKKVQEIINSQQQSIDTQASNIDKLVGTANKQQDLVTDLFDRVKHSETIVAFGFIILLVMVAAIIVDVSSNIWSKHDSAQQPAINIYR